MKIGAYIRLNGPLHIRLYILPLTINPPFHALAYPYTPLTIYDPSMNDTCGLCQIEWMQARLLYFLSLFQGGGLRKILDEY